MTGVAAVTGATGFLGAHVVPELRRRGWDVRALARTGAPARSLEATGGRVIRGDLHDAAALAALVDGADVVFHLAGLVAARSETKFHHVNAAGTAAIVRAAAAARIARIVHVSSLAAAGASLPGRPLADDAPPRPLTAYGRSKLASEAAVRAGGVPFTIVRPPVVYGPHDRQLVPAFRWARRGLVPIVGRASQELSLVYAGDLADALVTVATHPACTGGTYALVHPEIVTQHGLGEAIARAVGRRVLRPRIPAAIVWWALTLNEAAGGLRGRATFLSRDKARELLAPAWTARPDALARDTGWTAPTTLAAGLARTVAWYREAGWL